MKVAVDENSFSDSNEGESVDAEIEIVVVVTQCLESSVQRALHIEKHVTDLKK